MSILLIALLLAISDISLILTAIKKASLGWLVLAYLFAMGLTAYGAIKWWVLMPRNRSHPLTFVRVNFVSNFVGIFFPGIVGIEAARIAGITRSSKDLPSAFASVLVDRLFGLMTLAMVVAIGGLTASFDLPNIVKITCLLAIAGMIALVFILMSQTTRSLISRVLPAKVDGALHKLYECLDIYRDQPVILGLSLLLSLVFQLLRVVMVYLLTKSLGIDVTFQYLLIVVPIAIFVQMIPISIYGVGIRESAMVTLLSVVGVSTESAIALSLLFLAIQIAGSLPGAILFALGHKLPQPNGSDHET
ncbi:MAG: flippase-like domain-containing protein [Granulosicoccus sp.]|nr:flippase-like domain-containing protein [Granulosicoccus sp.]